MTTGINRLAAINNRGVAMLSDNTAWRIAPGLVAIAKTWALGTKVAVEDHVHFYWKFRLVNLDNGEGVQAVPWTRGF